MSALTVKVSNLRNRLGLIIYDQQHPSGLGGKDMYESAKEHYAKARRFVDELLELVHSGQPRTCVSPFGASAREERVHRAGGAFVHSAHKPSASA